MPTTLDAYTNLVVSNEPSHLSIAFRSKHIKGFSPADILSNITKQNHVITPFQFARLAFYLMRACDTRDDLALLMKSITGSFAHAPCEMFVRIIPLLSDTAISIAVNTVYQYSKREIIWNGVRKPAMTIDYDALHELLNAAMQRPPTWIDHSMLLELYLDSNVDRSLVQRLAEQCGVQVKKMFQDRLTLVPYAIKNMCNELVSGNDENFMICWAAGMADPNIINPDDIQIVKDNKGNAAFLQFLKKYNAVLPVTNYLKSLNQIVGVKTEQIASKLLESDERLQKQVEVVNAAVSMHAKRQRNLSEISLNKLKIQLDKQHMKTLGDKDELKRIANELADDPDESDDSDEETKNDNQTSSSTKEPMLSATGDIVMVQKKNMENYESSTNVDKTQVLKKRSD